MAPRKKKDAIVLADTANLVTVLTPQRQEAESALQRIARLDLSTQEKRDRAGQVLSDIRGRIQGLEELRVHWTKPILEAKRNIDNSFRPVRELWESCDRALEAALLAATARATEIQRAALALVAETAGNTDHETLTVAHDTPRDPEGTSGVDKWEWAIENQDEIPDEFWCIDAAKISAYVRQQKSDAKIPGIRVFVTKKLRRSSSAVQGRG